MIVISLARKPLIGSTTRNIMKFGVGGLNIEKTRCGWVGGAPSQDEWNRMGSSGAVGANGFAGQFSAGLKKAYADGLMPLPSGRWPANLVLQHKDGCRSRGAVSVPATSVPTEKGALRHAGVHAAAGGHQTVGRIQPRTAFGDKDGQETIEGWSCVPGCPVAFLDGQAGPCPTGGLSPYYENEKGDTSTSFFTKRRVRIVTKEPDAGGASRYFKQFGGNL